jgi:hypothetical protein
MEWIMFLFWSCGILDMSCGLANFRSFCLVRYRTRPDKTKKVNCQKRDATSDCWTLRGTAYSRRFPELNRDPNDLVYGSPQFLGWTFDSYFLILTVHRGHGPLLMGSQAAVAYERQVARLLIACLVRMCNPFWFAVGSNLMSTIISEARCAAMPAM